MIQDDIEYIRYVAVVLASPWLLVECSTIVQLHLTSPESAIRHLTSWPLLPMLVFYGIFHLALFLLEIGIAFADEGSENFSGRGCRQ